MFSTTLRIFILLAVLPIVVSQSVIADKVVGPLVGTVESATAKILYRPGATANSEYNLTTPDPSKSVRWGDQSFEEMMNGS